MVFFIIMCRNIILKFHCKKVKFKEIFVKTNNTAIVGGQKLFDAVSKPHSSTTKTYKRLQYRRRGVPRMFPLGNSKLNDFFEQVWTPTNEVMLDFREEFKLSNAFDICYNIVSILFDN